MEHRLWSSLDDLRYQPTLKRVRVEVDGAPVAATDHAVLIWEPQRVVPSYAVPAADVLAALRPATTAAPAVAPRSLAFGDGGPPLLDPSVPFRTHTASGAELDVVVAGVTVPGAAFRLDVPEPALGDLVVLDFEPFDWFEEDEPIVGHPRDPLHRIDVRRSSRAVRLEHHGTVLAASTRSCMLFEGVFPLVRFYLPVDDVAVPLRPGAAQTVCAYKGVATHWTATVGDEVLHDIAWSYPEPLEDALRVRSMIAFYQEHLDLFVDDQPVARVRTPWS
jgi:uncharacterized protein (DUF427 family)